eukprot:gnl/MRDRNA2_/MRDRNA2_122252_c0_seq1.p1 gnl/MRDRNA2_/MRDRNA2_122252_c0~~gnl/MRDRNA2_/MRDRNA2_122252_c0_seq1.p1  ORF type:complete len:478 (-),score=117.95 gnl/MRDRNA2_/MRDRNA2_122252_c0_seq1:103-1536(-)
MPDKKYEVSYSGVLLGMGNPLLDISNKVSDETIKKYELTVPNQILADPPEKYKSLFEELAAMEKTEYIAGGATQNSIRVCQWLLGKKGATSYMGCVGSDSYAEKMKTCAEKDGVNVSYMVDSGTPTGTCAVCIVDKERSLVANLSAANNYKVDHLKEADNMAILEKAKVVYSAGFFITVCPDAIALASKHCNDNGKTYCMNLSAPFIMEVPPFKECLMKTMKYIDVLFGNETEAQTFAKTEGWTETDIPSIAIKLSKLPKEGKPRTVVITQGSSPTIIAVDGDVREYPIIKLPKSKLKDTNGAGDAYVGGFLYGLVQEKDMTYCTTAGAYAASVIVQRSGCTFPAKPSFKPPPPPKPLKKPRFGKVGKIKPEQRGVNLMVKVVKLIEGEEGKAEVVLGDDTGVITCFVPEGCKELCKEGALLRLQNTKIVMAKGFMRIAVDKWAVMKLAAEDTPGGKPEFEVNKDTDMSATEYELAG